MALKDLVADKASLTEERIERVVSDYIHYYPDSGEIGLTQSGLNLKNDQKVLVYLTAVLGWPFVIDNPPSVSTKPADLEITLGISGGTLRPVLKLLKDAHLIASVDSGYTVRTGNLDEIELVVKGEKGAIKKSQIRKSSSSYQKSSPKKERKSDLATKIASWTQNGFFNEERTLREVHLRLHEEGIIVERTSVSGPLLRAVRSGLLKRTKKEIDGRTVWSYQHR